MSGRGKFKSKRGRSSFGFSNGKKRRNPGSVSETNQTLSSPRGDLETSSSNKSSWEARDNKRIHFDVLGRRVKGGTRNVLMSRSKAYAKRSHSILAEMVAAKKSNAFVDRRFGELGDGSSALDEESKALMRFKKERLRQLKVAKRSQRFSLNDDAEAISNGSMGGQIQLTHGGRAIGFDNDEDGEFNGRAFGPLDDDDEDDFDMSGVHFRGGNEDDDNTGGTSQRGFQSSRPAWMNSEGDGEGDSQKREGYHADGSRMSHKEIMEEVIAKSKAAKADRQRDKADMDSLLERLDAQAGVVQTLLRKRNRDLEDTVSGRKKKVNVGEASGESTVSVDGVALGDKAAKLLASALASVGEEEANEEEEDDGYRALLTQLASQPRGAIARNREKTEE
jgi:nucleolar protein 14